MLRLLRVTMLLAFIVGPVALASAQQALPPPLASIAGKDCGGRVLRIGGVVSGAIVWIRLSDDAQGPMAHLYFGGGFGSSAGVVPFSPHPPTNITPADYGVSLGPTGFAFRTKNNGVYTLTAAGQSLTGTYKESNGTMYNADLSCVPL